MSSVILVNRRFSCPERRFIFSAAVSLDLLEGTSPTQSFGLNLKATVIERNYRTLQGGKLHIYSQSYTRLDLYSLARALNSPNIIPYDLTNLNPSLPIGVPPLLNVATSQPKSASPNSPNNHPSCKMTTYHQLPPKPSRLQIPTPPTQAMLFA